MDNGTRALGSHGAGAGAGVGPSSLPFALQQQEYLVPSVFVPREPRDRNFHEWRHWSLVVPGVPIGGWPRLVRALSLLCKQWMTGRSQFESLAPAIWVEDIGRFIVLRSDHAHRAAGSEVVEVGCPACTHSHHPSTPHPPSPQPSCDCVFLNVCGRGRVLLSSLHWLG